MNKPLIQSLLILLLCYWSASATAQPGEVDNSPVSQHISELLQIESLHIRGMEILAQGIISDIYVDNEFNTYWHGKSDVKELLDLVKNAPDHGLLSADYGIAFIRDILRRRESATNVPPVVTAEDEILLTESLLRYGYHRRYGKARANSLDPDINFRREAFSDLPISVTMERLMSAPSLQGFIDLVAPSGPYYKNLQVWLERYRDIADAGGWSQVTEGPTLRKNDKDPRVVEIRNRLILTGELAAGSDMESTLFDDALRNAVIEFQYRHGLDDDGIVGKQSFAALNTTVQQRIDQIRVSLERLRWVNQEATDTMVVVNIASYQAFFFKNGKVAWATRTMVGKTYRKTPVFRGNIAYMEFNPTWTIPPTILRVDTLPAIKRDPNYLASKNIRVIDRSGKFVDPAEVDWNQYSRGVPYTLRQDPGPNNALGTVKFIFPNEHFVFLHDTPHRELFDYPERAFSSGCIRVEDPYRLAELLLDDPKQYPRSRFEEIVASKTTQRVKLAARTPVLILYLTAGTDSEGKLRFFKDIYDRDPSVLDALNGPVVIDPPEQI